MNSDDTGQEFAVHAIERGCQLSCQNGGYCTFSSHNSEQLLATFVNGGLIERCACPPGFTGLTCENVSKHGGTLGTDCTEADAVSAFAGAMCREPATSYCGNEGIKNRGFCTNGGLCGAYLRGVVGLSGSRHSGCQCPPEFEGPHCEYLKDHTPEASDEEVHEKSSAEQTVPAFDAPPSEALPKPIFKAKTIMSPVPPAQTNNSASQDNGVFINVGLAVCTTLSIFGLAIVAYQQLRRAKKHRSRELLRRDRFAVEPIRAKIYGELESPGGQDGYYDDDEYSVAERSECSLEEIELEDNELASNYREYLMSIRDGGFQTYFDKGEDRHDFSSIIGPIVNSRERKDID